MTAFGNKVLLSCPVLRRFLPQSTCNRLFRAGLRLILRFSHRHFQVFKRRTQAVNPVDVRFLKKRFLIIQSIQNSFEILLKSVHEPNFHLPFPLQSPAALSNDYENDEKKG